tara:strand:- start:17951 stop:18355 length:405 start_codon:yes stop_codon:yes gene_type:complete
MSVIATEKARLSNLVKYEEGGLNYYSRDEVTAITGQTINIGSVLGKITASGKYILSDADAVDGSQVAAAVCLQNLGTLAADAQCVVIVRDAIVSRAALVYDAANDAGEILIAEDELKALGILVRAGQADYTFAV